MDYCRPYLMPVLTILIVSSVYFLGWIKQMDAQLERTRYPTNAIVAAASDVADDIDQP